MTAQIHNALPKLVESYFHEHLQGARGASQRTVRAYRDAVRLLLMHIADTKGCGVADLQLVDLHVNAVVAFLTHLEKQRANSAATRNCRLAAIRSLFKHLIRHDPAHAEQYYRVLSLPSKKAKMPLATYLEPKDVRLLLSKPDTRTKLGRRDHAILLFLYNTGARVSEALGVTRNDLELSRPPQVQLHGKGRKDRICPLWLDTAQALQNIDTFHTAASGDPIFINVHGRPLTRDGVANIVAKYASMAKRDVPAMRRQRITPHVLRHSCAVALLQAGVDIVVIRDYLGHSSIATTSRYVKTNLKMKRDVLEEFWQHAGISNVPSTPWKPKPDLLAFLASL